MPFKRRHHCLRLPSLLPPPKPPPAWLFTPPMAQPPSSARLTVAAARPPTGMEAQPPATADARLQDNTPFQAACIFRHHWPSHGHADE